MLITLVVLSLVGAKMETPNHPAGKLKCLNPVHVNPKQEQTQDTGTDKCLAVPDTTQKPSKVRK